MIYPDCSNTASGFLFAMWTASQNTTIKRWAQDAAKAAVWGSNPEVLIEFSTIETGTIPPKELYEMAYQTGK